MAHALIKRLLLACVLAWTTTARADAPDKCSEVVASYLAQHSQPPVSAVHTRTMPIGRAVTWSDAMGSWVVALLVPGWVIKPQPWGYGFEIQGECVDGPLKLNVWFAKYAPQQAAVQSTGYHHYE